jgi:signal peptidase I
MVETTPLGPDSPSSPDLLGHKPSDHENPLRTSSLVLRFTHDGIEDYDPWFTPASIVPIDQARKPLQRLWPFGLHGLTETLEVIALALLMFVAVRGIAQNFVVDGSSMEPSFANGDMVIVNKLAYRTFDLSWLPFITNEWGPSGQPKQGDVVVFQFPFSTNRDFIKRIIAIPGQTIGVLDGQTIVDGFVLTEPYLLNPSTYSYGPATVPEGSVFVLGDARNNSYDSHSWGMLEKRFIIGRAEIRYWPPGDFGTIAHQNPGQLPKAGIKESR